MGLLFSNILIGDNAPGTWSSNVNQVPATLFVVVTLMLSNRSSHTIRQLVLLFGLVAVMYACMRTLRFTSSGLNLAFGCVFISLPNFAIKPVLSLPRRAKIISLAFLMPLSMLSAVGLLGMVACEIPAELNHRQLSEEICTLNQGDYSVHLAWRETGGGALGPHGLNLEQRRMVLPGIYAVRFLDYFEGASEGNLSFVGPNKISLSIPIAGYKRDQKNIQRVYTLKPWLYF